MKASRQQFRYSVWRFSYVPSSWNDKGEAIPLGLLVLVKGPGNYEAVISGARESLTPRELAQVGVRLRGRLESPTALLSKALDESWQRKEGSAQCAIADLASRFNSSLLLLRDAKERVLVAADKTEAFQRLQARARDIFSEWTNENVTVKRARSPTPAWQSHAPNEGLHGAALDMAMLTGWINRTQLN